jgi:hypothetical protein
MKKPPTIPIRFLVRVHLVTAVRHCRLETLDSDGYFNTILPDVDQNLEKRSVAMGSYLFLIHIVSRVECRELSQDTIQRMMNGYDVNQLK